jgi:U4/U6.U5 tri-snRNP-associated protein 1
MSMEESISLEETNKIRISLGLKPLTEDKPDTREQEAEKNYARIRDREAKDREAKCVHSIIHGIL